MLLERGCTITDATIEDAARWSRRLPASKLKSIERVVVAGGDGSLGVAASLASQLDVPLGVVPAGTANDFARAMELPDNPQQACVLAASGEELRAIDLAEVEGIPFVNVASFGLSPAAARSAKPLKGVLGALAYPIGAALSTVRSRPIDLVATVDGHVVWTGRAWQAMVASTGAFGGWASTGSTHDGDGALDLVIVPADRGTRRLAIDAAALMRGELAERGGVLHERGREIEITTRRAPQLVVDGELVQSTARQLTARVSSSIVQVVVA